MKRLRDVVLDVKLRFGSRRMLLRDVLALSAGVVVELDNNLNSPVDLLLDGRVVAQGEVVVVDAITDCASLMFWIQHLHPEDCSMRKLFKTLNLANPLEKSAGKKWASPAGWCPARALNRPGPVFGVPRPEHSCRASSIASRNASRPR